jgi:hypothetical protein
MTDWIGSYKCCTRINRPLPIPTTPETERLRSWITACFEDAIPFRSLLARRCCSDTRLRGSKVRAARSGKVYDSLDGTSPTERCADATVNGCFRGRSIASFSMLIESALRNSWISSYRSFRRALWVTASPRFRISSKNIMSALPSQRTPTRPPGREPSRVISMMAPVGTGTATLLPSTVSMPSVSVFNRKRVPVSIRMKIKYRLHLRPGPSTRRASGTTFWRKTIPSTPATSAVNRKTEEVRSEIRLAPLGD